MRLALLVLASVGGVLSSLKEGIDVTGKLGEIDWKKTKKELDIDFAIARCTGGTSYVDTMCVTNIKAIKDANLKLGVYHYFFGCKGDAKKQADHIKNTLKPTEFEDDDDVLAIDVESGGNEECSPTDMAQSLHTLLSELKDEKFKKVYIYTPKDYWQNKVMWQDYSNFFDDFPLWIPDFTAGLDEKKGPGNDALPTTWHFTGSDRKGGWTIWQYRNNVLLSGIIHKGTENEEVKTYQVWKNKAKSNVF